MRVTARNIRVVKKRTLLSAYRDVDYPQEMPFYLYGRQDEVFVDHMLLRAPNVQITAINPISLSGITLTDEQLAALRLKLTQREGRTVKLTSSVDPDLLGGLVVTIGSRRIDGSIRTRLNALAQAMAHA